MIISIRRYYHYYLRTSETSYLTEAHTFYQAVLERQYFAEVTTTNTSLFVKKLRFYARFIVVCLLLGNDKVDSLVVALKSLVESYTLTNQPDIGEWKIVLEEISTFIAAGSKCEIRDEAGVPFVFDQRPTRDSVFNHPIQEAVLIGAKRGQKKFSELTLDVYRLLHFLERPLVTCNLPIESLHDTPTTDATKKKKSNPHK